MPLQIRRGTEGQRPSITPLNGEPVYSSDTKKLFIGDGSTPGGVTLGYYGRVEVSGQDTLSATGNRDVLTVVAGSNIAVTTNSTTNSITISAATTFSELQNESIRIYQNNIIGLNSNENINVDPAGTGKLIVTGDTDIVGNLLVSGTVDGTFIGDVTGSVFADNSTLLVDSINSLIPASVVQGTFTGNVVGNVVGNVTGDVLGSVFGDDSTILVNGVNGSINLDGTLKGNVIPDQDTAYNLGSSSRRFNEIYIAPNGGINIDSLRLAVVNTAFEFDSRLRIIDRQTTLSSTSFFGVHNSPTDGSFISFARTRGTYESQTSIQSGDTIYELNFAAYDGSNFSNSASVRAYADPEGVVSSGVIPGKLEFWTTDDAGVESSRVAIDKNGRLISSGQFWAVTSVPTGLPIYALVNTNVTSNGARVAMRRSRGSFVTPTSVQTGDNLFRLMWGGHDGTSYRDTASIEANVSGAVSLGIIPTDLTVKTTSSSGSLDIVAKFTTDQTLQVDKISSLTSGSINFNSRIDGDIEGSVFADDSTKIIDGIDGKIFTPAITVSNFVKFPVYANPAARDSAITSPESGMVVFLTDSTGSGGSPKLQVNTDSTTGGWVDL